jgi:haloacetate dehalogenase
VRRISAQLRREGVLVNHKAVARHMRQMGLAGICPGPNLSKRAHQAEIYPYLLRDVRAERPNHIWGIDITYIRLGFETFAVVGHDRGGRVAHRLALDHPEKVSRLALLDIVPTQAIYASLNQQRATTVWRYFFLIQPYDLPERLIGAEVEFYLSWTLEQWSGTPNALVPEALAEYRRCFDTATIHASCEDYRAGASIDLVHDAASQGQKIACPLLVLWSATGLRGMYDVRAVWQAYAREVSGRALACGHFLAEERPQETAAELIAFLA